MKSIYLIAFLVFSSNYSWAQNMPIKSLNDLVGCWERVDFSEEAKKKINEIEPWPTRYQWFCFEQDGTLSSFMSTESKKMTPSELRELFKQIPIEFSFELLPNSIIKTEGKSAKQTIYWSSALLGNTVTFDDKVIEKGTLIMSLFDNNKKKVVYSRYLKRLS